MCAVEELSLLARKGAAVVASVVFVAALAACGSGTETATDDEGGSVDVGAVTFEVESADFAAALEDGADVMSPEARTVPGVGVVLAAPAAIPFAPPAPDGGPSTALGGPGVQDPAVFFVPLDGGAPTRIPLPDAADGRVRRVAGAAGVRERVVVALDSCQAAWFHEEGDHRTRDCDLELWDLDPAAGAARPLPDVDGVEQTLLVTMAATEEIVRASIGAQIVELRAGATDWQPVASGVGMACDVGDGGLVANAPGGGIQYLPGDGRDWVQFDAPPATGGTVTPLLCGPGVAYRTAIGTHPVVVVDRNGSRIVPSPVSSPTEVPGWVVDQVTGDLLLLGASGFAAQLAPDRETFDQVDVPVAEYQPSDGSDPRRPAGAQMLELAVRPDGTLVLGRF